MANSQIILDADVVIHFAKGGLLPILPKIFSKHRHIVLDKVYDEIKGDTRVLLDRQVERVKNIEIVKFEPKGEQRKEYALLKSRLGQGESACMVYCRYNKEVVGSSNLRDIRSYCDLHSIPYLTTLDFIYHAIQNSIITRSEAEAFVAEVKNRGSKLPDKINFDTYKCRTI